MTFNKGNMASSGKAVRCLLVQLSILYSLSFLADYVRSESLDVYSNFAVDSSSDETFFHLAVRSNGEVYISSQRYIYRLSDSLDVIERSNKTCSEDNCAIINKILVVDEDNERLITCGSDENEHVQSQCESRLIDDLTPEESAKDIVSHGHDSSIGYLATKDDKTYLYIAASVSSFYTISIRSTISFKVYDSNENTFRVKDFYKRDDHVNYVDGFSYERFRYFVANIYEFDNNIKGKVPRISRICDGDSLDHLSDIYLQCVNGTTKYQNIQTVYFGPAGSDLSTAFGVNKEDMLLYGVFTRSATNAESALCIYTLKDIEKAFDDAILGCLFSKANAEEYALTYGAPRTQCSATDNPASNVNIESYKCRNTDAISTSQGSVNRPTTADAVLALKNDKLTAITINIERGHTIAFLGTENGRLLKTHLTSNTSARIYEDIELDKRSPVRSDMIVNNETLLVLTEKELFRVRLENCAQYTTCDECIGTNLEEDGDPYCGWCTLDKKCSKYDTCSSGAWLDYNDICISINDVSPPNLPYNDGASTLEIKFTNLPALTGSNSYLCIFNGVDVTRQATLVNQTLYCESPAVLPPVPEGSDHVSVTIYIFSTLTQVKFIETSYDFYSCNVCSTCAASHFDCLWCPLENTCADGVSRSCSIMEDVPVNSELQCPQIASQTELEFFHTGMTKKIMIKANNLLNVSNYICVINGIDSVPATRIDDKNIICDDYTYVSDGISQEKNTTIEVVWNNTNYIDFNWKVTLYNCSVDQPDCSTCLSPLTTPPEYNCTWCNPGMCVLESSCSAGQPPTCPPPIVNEQCPQIASQTELEFFHTGMTKKIMIKANNLLNVSNYICVINGIDSVPATRIDDKNIICDDYTYVSDGISQEKNTTIEVVWNNTNYIDFNWKVTLYNCSVDQPDCSTCLSPLTTPPEYNCTWCNPGMCVLESRCSAGQPPSCPPPIVNEILPKVVPTSAGEQYVDVITLIGQDLGQRVEDLDIDVGGKPCKNRRKTYQVAKEISCKAPSFPNAGFHSVTVRINGNPTIVGTLEYQTPTFSAAQPSTGIMAGGTVIKITGNNLNFNSVSVSIHTADCVIIRNSNKEIECKTGSIESSGCWTIIVTFGNIEFSVFEYCYRTNPNIVDYFPKESIKSGGRVVTVDGINFQYVQNAKMIVEIEDQSFESNCTEKKQKSMICNSPAVDFSSARRKRQVNNIGGREATVRFILDSMDIDGNTNFTFFSDPVYYTFEGSTRYAIFVDEQGFYQLTDENKFLYLFGSNLTLASDERDISVFIGGIKMEVIRLTETHVEVALPEERLKSTLVTANHNNLYISFGEIIYLTNNINNIVLIVVRTMLLLGFLIFIAVMTLQYFFRRRKIKSVKEKEVKEAETTL